MTRHILRLRGRLFELRLIRPDGIVVAQEAAIMRLQCFLLQLRPNVKSTRSCGMMPSPVRIVLCSAWSKARCRRIAASIHDIVELAREFLQGSAFDNGQALISFINQIAERTKRNGGNWISQGRKP